MKRYIPLVVIFISYIVFFKLSPMVYADSYLVQDGQMSVPEELLAEGIPEEQTLIPIASSDRTLRGLIDHTDYYYSVPVQGAGKGSLLQFKMRYSPLLLPSSTITISIDEHPVKSVRIDPHETEIDVFIPLEEEMLTPGFHQVTVTYYGRIAHELCEDISNPANWLTILASSSVLLNDNDSLLKENVLDVYPYPFVRSEKENPVQAVIVIPNEPSADVLLSALKTSHFLSTQANGELVPIKREKELKRIDSHVIAIGTPDQWEELMGDLFHSTDIRIESDHLAISNFFLQSESLEKQIMFVTARDESTILEKIAVLTESALAEQLSGNHLSLDRIPEIEPNEVKEVHQFRDLYIPSIQLADNHKRSDIYFYQLPTYIDQTEDASLSLRFNFSSRMLIEDELAFKQGAGAEIVLYVNEIPHSIRLNNLTKEPQEAFYEVTVPIAAEILNKERYITLQFEGNGIINHDPCALPSAENWIYIDEESYIKLPIKNTSGAKRLDEWPAPFITHEVSKTTIVLPNSFDGQLINQLNGLVRHIGNHGTLAGLELLFAEDVTDEQLQNRDVIILGHIHDHPGLDDYLEQLMVNVDELNRWDVSEYQFLQDTSAYVAWIQPSVWDKNRAMAVMSSIHPDQDLLFSNTLIEYLQTNKVAANIAVENQNGEIFTYIHEQESEDDQSLLTVEPAEEEYTVPIWIIIGFIAVTLIGVIILLTFLRRRVREK